MPVRASASPLTPASTSPPPPGLCISFWSLISTRVTSPHVKCYREIHFLFRGVLGNEAISVILNQHILSIVIQLLGFALWDWVGPTAGKVVSRVGPRAQALGLQQMVSEGACTGQQ